MGTAMLWHRIREAAKAIVDRPGDIDIVEKMRQIDSAASELGYGLKEPFLTIKSVVSQLDNVPSAKARHLWSEKALAEIDASARIWLKDVEPQILNACHQILRQLAL